METEAAPTEIKRKKEQVSCQPEKQGFKESMMHGIRRCQDGKEALHLTCQQDTGCWHPGQEQRGGGGRVSLEGAKERRRGSESTQLFL